MVEYSLSISAAMTGDIGTDKEDDPGAVEFGPDGFQGFGDMHFYRFFGNRQFIGDLRIAFMLFPAEFKDQPAFFGQALHNTVNIFLQELGGYLFFDLVFIRYCI